MDSTVLATDPKRFIHELVGKAIERINRGISQTLTARLTNESPPKDSRHLTDTRTRVSTLLEYSLAYEINQVLDETDTGFSVSSVLWNVFPDLIIRNERRENVAGLEVKALHTAAEEKSANLSTPLQIIRKNKDYLVIMIWGWHQVDRDGVGITYPHIHDFAVADAWLLAKIRDISWLFNQKGRIKGIDLCSPIIDGGSNFKAEEGNMGKLMRIALSPSVSRHVPLYAEMESEANAYSEFKDRVLASGLRESFKDICILQECEEITVSEFSSYPATARKLGNATRPDGRVLMLLAGNNINRWLSSNTSTIDYADGSFAFWFSSKLNWKIFQFNHGRWEQKGEGEKPESEYEKVEAILSAGS